MRRMSFESLKILHRVGQANNEYLKLCRMIKWITKDQYKEITGEDWSRCSDETLDHYDMWWVLTEPTFADSIV